jgi:hypothetical protein
MKSGNNNRLHLTEEKSMISFAAFSIMRRMLVPLFCNSSVAITSMKIVMHIREVVFSA